MHIHHLTITTGHSRRSWRHEIDPEALRRCGEILARAIDGERPRLLDGCSLQVTASGRCMIGTVWAPHPAGGADVPVVTFGVAQHSRCGAGLWRMLTSGVPVTGLAAVRAGSAAPQEPWCAARLEPGCTLVDHAVMEWIGDMERCIAWAWLDRLEKRRSIGMDST